MKRIAVTYCIFDILEIDGADVKAKPLEERKVLLYETFSPVGNVAMWGLPTDKEGWGTVFMIHRCIIFLSFIALS